MADAVLTGGFSGVVEDGAVDCVGELDDVELFEDIIWLECVNWLAAVVVSLDETVVVSAVISLDVEGILDMEE